MIIDEGFLSNAKKIAETQPQHSEVKVPEIKRENYEYQVKITLVEHKNYNDLDLGKDMRKLCSRIHMCDIFKETSDIEINNVNQSCIFESDMMITTDTIYQMSSILNFNDTIYIVIEIKGNGLDFSTMIKKIRLDKVYYSDEPGIAGNMTLKKLWDIYRNKFGISGRATLNWLRRNDVVYAAMDPKDAKMRYYPAYIEDIRSILTTYENTIIYYPVNRIPFIKPNVVVADDKDDVREIIEGNEGLLHVNECFVSIANSFISTSVEMKMIQIEIIPMNPVMIENDYIYVRIRKSITEDNKEEYMHMMEQKINMKGNKLGTENPDNLNYKMNIL